MTDQTRTIHCCDCHEWLPATPDLWPPSALAGTPGVRCKPCGTAYFQAHRFEFAERRARDMAALKALSAYELRKRIQAKVREGKPVPKRLVTALLQAVGRMEKAERRAAVEERRLRA